MPHVNTVTLLSLPRFAKLMGIAPMHMAGAKPPVNTGGQQIFPYGQMCNDMWYQYSWQAHDRVCREDLAYVIADAEQDIATVLGYYPAPVWISNDVYPYPVDYDGGKNIYDVNGSYKNIILKWGRFIRAGMRAVTPLVAPTAVVYSDADGDGWDETATITVPTTLTDERFIKAYYPGHGGEQEWEIREPRSKGFVGPNIVIKYYAWQLINPDAYEEFPTEDTPQALGGIDMSTIGNLLATVDVYREYTDSTIPSAVFYFEPYPTRTCTVCGGAGCAACGHTIENGCLIVRDIKEGIVVPQPATFNANTGVWEAGSFASCIAPDIVKCYYYAGNISQKYLSRRSTEPLDDWFAQTIAWLTVARLERNFCSCQNLTALQNGLRNDLAVTSGNVSYYLTPDVLDCPFGTKQGEVMAWRRLKRLADKRSHIAII